jgi:uncharacterized glyoxalase superfamily protein PhnB
MVQNPPKDMPRIVPYLHYRNMKEALEWLSSAFGFQASFTLADKEGNLMHAEMRFADGVIMFGPANEEHGGLSPLDLAGVNQGLYIYVENVDAHFENSKAGGAVIVMQPEDMFWGDRVYAAKDIEGHRWTFGQHVKDVAPEEMRPPAS